MRNKYVLGAASLLAAPGIALGALAWVSAPAAHADQATQGQPCTSWHATAQDSNGQALTCTHTSDSGHLMYWEYGGPQDS